MGNIYTNSSIILSSESTERLLRNMFNPEMLRRRDAFVGDIQSMMTRLPNGGYTITIPDTPQTETEGYKPKRVSVLFETQSMGFEILIPEESIVANYRSADEQSVLSGNIKYNAKKKMFSICNNPIVKHDLRKVS